MLKLWANICWINNACAFCLALKSFIILGFARFFVWILLLRILFHITEGGDTQALTLLPSPIMPHTVHKLCLIFTQSCYAGIATLRLIQWTHLRHLGRTAREQTVARTECHQVSRPSTKKLVELTFFCNVHECFLSSPSSISPSKLLSRN